jgi:hypothetical protein
MQRSVRHLIFDDVPDVGQRAFPLAALQLERLQPVGRVNSSLEQ